MDELKVQMSQLVNRSERLESVQKNEKGFFGRKKESAAQPESAKRVSSLMSDITSGFALKSKAAPPQMPQLQKQSTPIAGDMFGSLVSSLSRRRSSISDKIALAADMADDADDFDERADDNIPVARDRRSSPPQSPRSSSVAKFAKEESKRDYAEEAEEDGGGYGLFDDFAPQMEEGKQSQVLFEWF